MITAKPRALESYILRMVSLGFEIIPLSLKVTEGSGNWNSAAQIIM